MSSPLDGNGVAAAETSPEVKSLCELHEVLLSANRARHVAWYKLSPFIEKVLDAAIALEKAQRALSASPLPPEGEPVADRDGSERYLDCNDPADAIAPLPRSTTGGAK